MGTNSTSAFCFMRRELIRAVLERTQVINMMGMLPDAEQAENFRYDDVVETLNVPYVNREEVALAMDIFQPADAEGRELPVIVTIHGGGLTIGDRGISRPLGRVLAHKGYLVFSVAYRLAPRASVAQELGDVCAGLDRIGELLVDYDVDFDRIYLVAESAGAFLALYVAAMHGSKSLQQAIGYPASRLNFRALALNCGMFYTNGNDPLGWVLSEQIYGERRDDDTFLKYMNPEHPEIISNLPPAYLFTSRSDFLNNYTFRMHDALQALGKTSKLVYYPDDHLMHAFLTLQTYDTKTLESIDAMLAWLEEQSQQRIEARAVDPAVETAQARVDERRADGSILHQSTATLVRELISADPARLATTAMIDGTREYTYQEVFDEWDRYARVFSALGMTDKNRSRVAIAGAIAAEPLNSFFALSMTGAAVSMFSYPDLLPSGTWRTMLEKERITDFLITDMMVSPALWREIMAAKEELGLRNVILLHTKLGGPTVGPSELVYNEMNYHALKREADICMMEDLLERYAETPIYLAPWDEDAIELIAHTSGSTHGTRKPLPFTNAALNTAILDEDIERMLSAPELNMSGRQHRFAPSFDFSSFLCCATSCLCLALGNTLVLTCFGFMHPKFVRAIGYYRISMLFTSSFMLDPWLARDDLADADFSSVRILGCGGSYTPPEKYRRYQDFLRSHGYAYNIIRGYGMSEAGGAQLFAHDDEDLESLGQAASPEDVMIGDSETGEFFHVSDGPRTGVLYLASGSLCTNELDGEKLFDFTEIDGRNYVCTNDLVRVSEDGRLLYAGRADRYFVNNEGVRFEAGIVEMRMAAEAAISQCAVVPAFEKRIHDTVPVLYVVPDQMDALAPERVRAALADVYVAQGIAERTVLPTQFVLVPSIPVGATGKVDIYRITRDRLTGDAYDIVPVRDGDTLVDVAISHNEHLSSMKAGTVPEGLEGVSSLGMFEAFNPATGGSHLDLTNPFNAVRIFRHLLGRNAKKDGRDQKTAHFEMPAELMSWSMKAMGTLYGRRDYDRHIEN